ncbi:phosphotransferase [Streptomyces sp. NPDC058221]|uniref:phosphotransferase n=1 Tax=Streptomyces sp. NPDC058221 TaxID=3346388 RepID=UPI0036E4B5D4
MGCPTPAWPAVGATADGFGYRIQEFVPGHSRNQVTATRARLLITVLERHAGIDPDPQHCWSRFVREQVTGRRDELLRAAAERGPTGQPLADACERLLAAHGTVALPTGGLVHGDFRPGNILFQPGRVSGVIDIEALGSGSRSRADPSRPRRRGP